MRHEHKENKLLIYLGFVISILSIFFGAWIGLWVLFAGGIMDIVSGFSSDPWNATMIGWGAVKWISAGFVGWVSIFVGWALGSFIISVGRGI